MWTMEQLVERVGVALAAEYPGAPNGRVREVPDRRSIRWYTTIGLVDRPLGTRGRTVFYGPRHLLQLVAIKRRQAAGLTLAEIQTELAGATEETLAEVARVPGELLATDTPHAESTTRPLFWKTAPAAPTETGFTAHPAHDDDHTSGDVGSPDTATSSPDLTAGPADATTGSPGPTVGRADNSVGSPGTTRRALAAVLADLDEPASPVPGLITGIPLGGGVVLLLPRHTADIDIDDLTEAARPLLDLLASRGLTDGRNA